MTSFFILGMGYIEIAWFIYYFIGVGVEGYLFQDLIELG